MTSIINQVNDYLDHNNSFVILDMPHMYNTDDDWRKLDNDEFGRLLTQLNSIEYRYDGPTGPNGDLSSLPLNTFIGNSPRIIILNSGPSVTLSQPAPPGIFPSSALNIFNSFSDTGDAQTMKEDQLSKLAAHATTQYSCSPRLCPLRRISGSSRHKHMVYSLINLILNYGRRFTETELRAIRILSSLMELGSLVLVRWIT